MPRARGSRWRAGSRARAQPPLVIFVTAYDTHAIEAFELHTLDYVLSL